MLVSHTLNTRAFGGRAGRGFTLIELLVVIAIIALLIGILLPALGAARRSARTAGCFVNMRSLGQAQNNYASVYREALASFTWAGGKTNDSPYADLNKAWADDAAAAAAQAAFRIRSIGGKTDFPTPPGFGFSPYAYYANVVLGDFLSNGVLDPSGVCTEDRNMLKWRKNPDDKAAVAESYGSDAAGVTEFQKAAAPYASSYKAVPASWSPDNRPTVRQTSTYTIGYTSPGPGLGTLGRRRIGEVQFPSQKVWLMDPIARHSRKPDYYAYEDTQQPLLFFDGSVVNKKTADSNPGWDPTSPTRPPVQITYDPRPWDPVARDGAVFKSVPYYMYTRRGLAGLDFGAPEVK